jgi:hypothetical protein
MPLERVKEIERAHLAALDIANKRLRVALGDVADLRLALRAADELLDHHASKIEALKAHDHARSLAMGALALETAPALDAMEKRALEAESALAYASMRLAAKS